MKCPFQNVGILGFGLIGGSIAKRIKNTDPFVKIKTLKRIDADQRLASMLIDETFDSKYELINNIDCLIVATPLSAIIESVKSLISKKSLIVIDTGSVKQNICEVFENLTDESIDYVPTHPMAGSEKNGFEASHENLFMNASWIITPHKKNQSGNLKKVEELIIFLGAKPISMSAAEHDKKVALISHLPYLISCNFLQFVKNQDFTALKIAGPGFQSFTRIALDNKKMHEEIFVQNQENIILLLEEWIAGWKKT